MDQANAPTVEDAPIANAPVANAPANKRKMVVIALPGREFSGNFLVAWTKALHVLWQRNYEVVVVNRFSSFVTFSRMQTLGLDVLRGVDQKPFNGELNYDVWVSIDSDVIFSHEQLIELIEGTDVHPVTSGMYRMADLAHFAMVADWDEAHFAEHGTFKFLSVEDVETWKKTTGQTYMPVSYAGMGFWAMRREALEALRYPFFDAPLQEITRADGTKLRDMCSEDVAFCKNLEKAGYTIYVNTNLRCGHEKMLII